MKNNSVIEQLYFRLKKDPLSPKLIQLQKEVYFALKKYRQKLSKDGWKDFDSLCEIMDEENAEECLCEYVEGFKFGLLMGIEVAGGR